MRKIALSISEIKDIEKREFLRLGDSFKLMEQAGEACAKQIIKIGTIVAKILLIFSG